MLVILINPVQNCAMAKDSGGILTSQHVTLCLNTKKVASHQWIRLLSFSLAALNSSSSRALTS